MKRLNTVLMVLLLGMLGGTAYAGSSLCGDGTYDRVIGQYSGSHPDGTDALNMVFNLGGTGSFTDQVNIGGGDWWVAGQGFPNGSPGFASFTWKKIKNGTYAAKAMALAGSPTPLSGLGAFPIKDFYRVVAVANLTLSSDCSKGEVYVTRQCFFNADAQLDPHVNHNVNTGGSCEDESTKPDIYPIHLMTVYKVAP